MQNYEVPVKKCVEWMIPQRTEKQTDTELNNFIWNNYWNLSLSVLIVFSLKNIFTTQTSCVEFI